MKMTYTRTLIEDLMNIDADAPMNRQMDAVQTVLAHALRELERHELRLAELSKSTVE